jgi:hypothetical protein
VTSGARPAAASAARTSRRESDQGESDMRGLLDAAHCNRDRSSERGSNAMSSSHALDLRAPRWGRGGSGSRDRSFHGSLSQIGKYKMVRKLKRGLRRLRNLCE